MIATRAPAAPVVGETDAILGVGSTVKEKALLDTPLTVTTTFPVVAPVGTVTTISVALQLFVVPRVPLKVTVLVPLLDPKLAPLIVIEAPTGPDVGERLVIEGGDVTVKVFPLLALPLTVTITDPVVAPVGTEATMLVELQLDGVEAVPLNLTVLPPWLGPKFVPAIVTGAVMAPDVGEMLLITGNTTNATPLLAIPPTVTTTFPLVTPEGTVATICVPLQVAAVAVTPLKATVLLPWVAPKAVPLIVTEVPALPEAGEILVIVGADVTVKLTELLARPPTVTTAGPVVAPVGTVVTMLVPPQLVGLALLPLKVIVLVP